MSEVISYNQLSPYCKNTEWRSNIFSCSGAKEKPGETRRWSSVQWYQTIHQCVVNFSSETWTPKHQSTSIVWPILKLVLLPQNKTGSEAPSCMECRRGSMMGHNNKNVVGIYRRKACKLVKDHIRLIKRLLIWLRKIISAFWIMTDRKSVV